jgi:hypothetical protein
MSIPKNITKQNLIDAAEKIIKDGIPSNGHSSTYDVIYKDNLLPPKLVVSYANIFANGTELNRNSFEGGDGTDCFKLLEKSGFLIQPKKKDFDFKIPRKVWVEKTNVKGRKDRIIGDRALGKALWSPQKGKPNKRTGTPADIYKNMRKVNLGDIVLHLTDSIGITGISIAKSDALETIGLETTDWKGDAYIIYLEKYIVLNPIISREDILTTRNLDILKEISNKSEVFYNRKLNLREGAYLTPCPRKLYLLINQEYLNKTGKNLPYFEGVIVDKLQKESNQIRENHDFDISLFYEKLNVSNLKFQEILIKRFISSLLTKPFVILSGLSGSGKTKLAQAFAQWICQDDSQYCIIPVGADWTNREPLLGYPNALKPDEYIKPDNGALDVIIKANIHPELPHFLILDEMNLSHVERYFADFLSVMESKGDISLFAEGTVNNGVPSKLALPSNLFIIGTVNIDETTYMFSPKVLDRANAIEFRVTKNEIENFFVSQKDVDMNKLKTQGASMAQSFLEMAEKREFEEQDLTDIHKILVNFFEQLKKTGAEFGYRSASEIIRLINQLTIVDADLSADEKLDIAIMQKLLPKLHGSRRKLCPVLITLGGFCVDKAKIENIEKDIFSKEDFDFEADGVFYPISLEKITRMYKGAIENGFASYAEA